MPKLIRTTIVVTVLSERDIQDRPLTVISQGMYDGDISGTYEFKKVETLRTKFAIKKACEKIYTDPGFFFRDD